MDDFKQLIKQVFAPKKGEKVIILNDFPEDDLEIDNDYIERRSFARHWHLDFIELSKTIGFKVEELITYEPTRTSNKPLPTKAIQLGKEIELDKYLSKLSEKDIVVAITRYSATASLSERAKTQNFRGASMPGVTDEMSAFEADYSIVAKKAKILADKMTKAKYAEVEFSTGNKIKFDLRGKVPGLIDDGNLTQPGKFGNLPAGEAFTCPYEGFDKKLGISQTNGEIPVYYGEEKVTFIVQEGKIIDFNSLGEKAKNAKKLFEEDNTRRYIAELGLGCNDKAEFCGKTIQDEKIEGMHFAYGFNGHFGGAITADKFKSENTILHQDIIYSEQAKVWIKKFEFIYDNGSKETIIIEGKYLEGLFD